jgi:parvulin-like peptidyl-prolyl isomerase
MDPRIIRPALREIPFGTVGGEAISLYRALRLLKLCQSNEPRPARSWGFVVVEYVVIEQAAASLGLAPPDEEVDALMREYRTERKLFSAALTEQYLARMAWTVDDLWDAMALVWKERALHRRFAEEPAGQYFVQHSTEFDAAVLSELVVEQEDLAAELLLQIKEEGAEFAELVQRYSVGATRARAGLIGEVRRGALNAATSAAVFGAETGDVVGPFPHQKQYRLLEVHASRRAELTPEVRTEIQKLLWREWLERQVRAAQADLTIMAHL